MPAESLAELQSVFYALVTAPSGVRAGLAEAQRSEASLSELIRGDTRLSAVERLDLYANMYFFRILDVLRDDYARLVPQIGDAPFHNLVTDYLLACRPNSWTLRNAGERLPEFLKRHPLGIERPWLRDLARLERQRLEVFDAADGDVLTLAHLRALPPEDYAGLFLRLIPAHARIAVDYAIEPIWKSPETVATPTHEPHTLWVWRQDVMIFHRPMTEIESHLYDDLARGLRFETLCETIETNWPARDAAVVAFELLARLVEDGLLLGYQPKETTWER